MSATSKVVSALLGARVNSLTPSRGSKNLPQPRNLHTWSLRLRLSELKKKGVERHRSHRRVVIEFGRSRSYVLVRSSLSFEIWMWKPKIRFGVRWAVFELHSECQTSRLAVGF